MVDTPDPKDAQKPKIALNDFYAHLADHKYFYTPTMEPWPAASVNSLFPSGKKSPPAHVWLDRHRSVQQITYAPGYPMLIEDLYVVDGGWIPHPGARCLNRYRPPTIKHGDPAQALPWVWLIHFLWPNEANHIIFYFAHCVQRPHIKINHLLLLAGIPGIGKDMILAPVRRAVGEWNFAETTAERVMGQFTDFLKCVILRINEARDLGDIDGYKFYNRLKWIAASPPETRLINEKHLRPYYIPNLGGVVVTSNHRTGSIFPEPDDRRVFATWSEITPADFPGGYFDNLGYWYEHGALPGYPDDANSGFEHVAAYLATLDISSFNPYAPPPRTPAFRDLINANVSPEAASLADLLDDIGKPVMVTLDAVKGAALDQIKYPGLSMWLCERKNWNTIPYRFDQCGYVRLHNDRAKDGLWKIDGRRQVVYAPKDLSPEIRAKVLEFLAAGTPEQREKVQEELEATLRGVPKG
jgi:hypothetical protein